MIFIYVFKKYLFIQKCFLETIKMEGASKKEVILAHLRFIPSNIIMFITLFIDSMFNKKKFNILSSEIDSLCYKFSIYLNLLKTDLK